MFFLYDIILVDVFVLYLPYLFWRRKWHKDFLMRLGFLPPGLVQSLRDKPNIWVHAVSVGEVLAVKNFIRQIREEFPRYNIVISVVTKTGYEVARSQFQTGETIIFAPLDFTWAARKFADTIAPKVYVAAETEIWPNLLRILQNKNIPIAIINGRISQRSYDGYRRISFLMKPILNGIAIFCMQSAADAKRIIELGARVDRVHAVGNVKFDELPAADEALPDFGFEKSERLWIAGSTHPGEEDILLDLHKMIQTKFPDLRLVLAPRHIERSREIIYLVEEKNFRPVLLSKLRETKLTPHSVVIVDTMGKLRSLYPLAAIVFVGKSLLGRGGQNVIEPASFSKPVLVGPHTDNFRDVIRLFCEANAIIQVRNPQQLGEEILRLLQSPEERSELGRRAYQVVKTNQGATAKSLEFIRSLLKSAAYIRLY